jgi:hypothetical protein
MTMFLEPKKTLSIALEASDAFVGWMSKPLLGIESLSALVIGYTSRTCWYLRLISLPFVQAQIVVCFKKSNTQ